MAAEHRALAGIVALLGCTTGVAGPNRLLREAVQLHEEIARTRVDPRPVATGHPAGEPPRPVEF